MREGFRIIDADRHVMEPLELWQERLDPALRAYAPYAVADHPSEPMTDRLKRLGNSALVPLPPRILIDGEPIYRELPERTRVELALNMIARMGDLSGVDGAVSHLTAMDRDGIDVAFLYPTLGLFLAGFDSLAPELVGAFARAYNDWLRDFCASAPERLLGAGLIPLHDPGVMVAEVERVVRWGFRLVVVRPNPIRGRSLSDPAFEPFWSACERLSVGVAVHEGTHARAPSAGADRFTTRFALHACSHPMEQMMALLALIEGGVLERHPGLRIAFFEAGCGWLPYWLWRLDEEYDSLAGEVAGNVRRPPSEYFRRQCFVAIEPGEPSLPEVVRRLGEDNLIFGTDFPHVDHAMDLTARTMGLRERLPETALRKLLWDNAARLHGLLG
jgi:predicted TIM-barrel fold metal-dependent hydrolase